MHSAAVVDLMIDVASKYELRQRYHAAMAQVELPFRELSLCEACESMASLLAMTIKVDEQRVPCGWIGIAGRDHDAGRRTSAIEPSEEPKVGIHEMLKDVHKSEQVWPCTPTPSGRTDWKRLAVDSRT